MALFNITKEAKQFAAEQARQLRQREADETSRRALLDFIKQSSPRRFDELGFTEDTSRRAILDALSVAESFNESEQSLRTESFLRGRNAPTQAEFDAALGRGDTIGQDLGRDVSAQQRPRVTAPPGAPLSLQMKAEEANIALQKSEAQSEIDVKESLNQKISKDQLQTSQDLLNVDLKIDNSFDTFLDVANRTMELTKAGPGVIGGTFSSVLGALKANEYVEGFEGSLIEVAAAVGRVAIPGARATRLVDLFKNTGISINDTIESAVATSADSFRNAVATDMSRNAKEYLTPEQQKLPRRQQTEFLKESLREFERTYRDTLFRKAYAKNPALLSKDTRQRVEALLRGEKTLKKLGLDPNKYEIIGAE